MPKSEVESQEVSLVGVREKGVAAARGAVGGHRSAWLAGAVAVVAATTAMGHSAQGGRVDHALIPLLSVILGTVAGASRWGRGSMRATSSVAGSAPGGISLVNVGKNSVDVGRVAGIAALVTLISGNSIEHTTTAIGGPAKSTIVSLRDKTELRVLRNSDGSVQAVQATMPSVEKTPAEEYLLVRLGNGEVVLQMPDGHRVQILRDINGAIYTRVRKSGSQLLPEIKIPAPAASDVNLPSVPTLPQPAVTR